MMYLRDCQSHRDNPYSRDDQLGGHHPLVGAEGVHDGAVPGREGEGVPEDWQEAAGEGEEAPVEADEDQGEHGDVDRED